MKTYLYNVRYSFSPGLTQSLWRPFISVKVLSVMGFNRLNFFFTWNGFFLSRMKLMILLTFSAAGVKFDENSWCNMYSSFSYMPHILLWTAWFMSYHADGILLAPASFWQVIAMILPVPLAGLYICSNACCIAAPLKFLSVCWTIKCLFRNIYLFLWASGSQSEQNPIWNNCFCHMQKMMEVPMKVWNSQLPFLISWFIFPKTVNMNMMNVFQCRNIFDFCSLPEQIN